MKRAVAKCKQQDAPELELPPFRSSFKFVNMLMNSADEMDQYKINKMFNFMKSFEEISAAIITDIHLPTNMMR